MTVEVAFYTNALTAAQILNHYEMGNHALFRTAQSSTSRVRFPRIGAMGGRSEKAIMALPIWQHFS